MRASERLSRLRIVLKDTTHPGNIGATARAMKTMGLSQLHLANPKTFIDDTAKAMAAGAADILETLVSHPTLPAAVADCTQVFALTARRRDLSPPALPVREAMNEALARATVGGPVAIVFGGERSGLDNEDILLANVVVEIPTAAEYSSLNLAQAVQIVTYELRQALALPVATTRRTPVPRHSLEALLQHLQQALHHIGLPKAGDTRPLLPRLRRLLTRADLDESEARLLRGICRAILAAPPKNRK